MKSLSKTYAYIKVIGKTNDNRRGHHVYVIEQRVLNLPRALCDLNAKQLAELDDDCLAYLKRLDTPIDKK